MTIQKLKDELNTVEYLAAMGGAQHKLIMKVFIATIMKIERDGYWLSF